MSYCAPHVAQAAGGRLANGAPHDPPATSAQLPQRGVASPAATSSSRLRAWSGRLGAAGQQLGSSLRSAGGGVPSELPASVASTLRGLFQRQAGPADPTPANPTPPAAAASSKQEAAVPMARAGSAPTPSSADAWDAAVAPTGSPPEMADDLEIPDGMAGDGNPDETAAEARSSPGAAEAAQSSRRQGSHGDATQSTAHSDKDCGSRAGPAQQRQEQGTSPGTAPQRDLGSQDKRSPAADTAELDGFMHPSAPSPPSATGQVLLCSGWSRNPPLSSSALPQAWQQHDAQGQLGLLYRRWRNMIAINEGEGFRQITHYLNRTCWGAGRMGAGDVAGGVAGGAA